MIVLLLPAHAHFRKTFSVLIQYDMAVFSSEGSMNAFILKTAPLQRCFYLLVELRIRSTPEARCALANLSSLFIPIRGRAK